MPAYLFIYCPVLYLLACVAYRFVEIYYPAYCSTALARVDWCSFTALLVALRSYSGVWYSPYLFLVLPALYCLLCVSFSSSALALSLVLSRLVVVVGSEEYF